MLIVQFEQGTTFKMATGLYQYDYKQVLRIQGLDLPLAVEIHFALQERGGESVSRIGVTRDGVTDVVIPDTMLENSDTSMDYDIYAFVYLTDETSGQTEYKMKLRVKSRPRPEAFDKPEDAQLFRDAIAAVNEAADHSETAEKNAEGWAHGRQDMPERSEDNAAYYAGQAKDILVEIPGKVKDAKKAIDEYVDQKETELKGDTGNVYFAAFKVVNGRLKMYSDPEIDKVRFVRAGSRMLYRLAF